MDYRNEQGRSEPPERAGSMRFWHARGDNVFELTMGQSISGLHQTAIETLQNDRILCQYPPIT